MVPQGLEVIQSLWVARVEGFWGFWDNMNGYKQRDRQSQVLAGMWGRQEVLCIISENVKWCSH